MLLWRILIEINHPHIGVTEPNFRGECRSQFRAAGSGGQGPRDPGSTAEKPCYQTARVPLTQRCHLLVSCVLFHSVDTCSDQRVQICLHTQMLFSAASVLCRRTHPRVESIWRCDTRGFFQVERKSTKQGDVFSSVDFTCLLPE